MERTARILVVDDDIDVRDFVSAMLTQENFDAVSAQDGGEALALLGAGDYDLLLTDIRMPGVNGFEFVKRARQTRPDLRVLFMSGYAAEYHIDPDRDDFVAKPFDPRQLLGCIYEILARKGGESRA
jgi:two-component system cell cycle sensor histidine kinase/response regulator CckA